jgi:energy-converting hydrogenase A subunit R
MTAGQIFISDCEGPISKNDNAFEVAQAFIPRGDHFFSLISRYDDVLADVVKRPGYRAGNTLKLITPFLKAYGVTNAQLVEYASDNIVVLHGAKEMLHHLLSTLPSFIVSTSYEQYISALCARMDFPLSNVYCTQLDLDRYDVPLKEAAQLRELTDEVTSYPMIHIPDHTTSIQDFSKKDRATIMKLDEVFWKTIPRMTCGRMLEEITPIGSEEKAKAVMAIASNVEGDLAEVVYVGDSITDVQALQLVKAGGGLAVSFNGNRYAVANAEIAVLSDTALVTAILVDVFTRRGKKEVLDLARSWSRQALEEAPVKSSLITTTLENHPSRLPYVQVVDDQNVEALIEESSRFRTSVRGEAIGRLG